MYAIDIETDGLDPRKNKIASICIHHGGKSQIYERCRVGQEGLIEAVKAVDGPVVMHNAKFDCSFIREDLGVVFSQVHCTYIMSKVLQNGKDFSNSLVNCLQYYLGITHEMSATKGDLQKSFSIKRPMNEDQRRYLLADTENLIPLYEKLDDLIKRNGLSKVIALEERLMPILIEIESRGVRIDVHRLSHLVHRWKQCIKILVSQMDRELGAIYDRNPRYIKPLFLSVNYNSTQDVCALFKSLGQKPPVKYFKAEKEWRNSIDYDTLGEYLAANPSSPLYGFIHKLFRYKEYEKLRSTYGEAILGLVDANGYLHTTYRQIDTDTARLSSSNPNLQNIGNSGPGATVRNCFLPDEGDLIVDVDMDAVEIRIAADKSNDRLLVDSIVGGADMHSVLASRIFTIMAGEPVTISKSKEPITIKGHTFIPSKLRDFSKTGHFARLYKGGAARMKAVYADYLFKLTPVKGHDEVCKGIVQVLDESMPELTKWANDRISEGKEKGILRETKFGRIRYFSSDEYGSICNYPIQCVSAEAMKVAIINAHKYLSETGYGRILLTIHDQLVVSARAERAEEVKENIVEIMKNAIGYFLDKVPGGATGKITKVFEK
jgi:DNA polymerase-1